MRRRVAPTLGLITLCTALVPGLGSGFSPGPISVQDRDVELLGQIYGTRPPDAYFERRARDPGAFQMERGMVVGRGRFGSGGQGGGALPAWGDPSLPALGTRPVRGAFRFPVILGLFADSPPPPFATGKVQAHFFDGPNPTGTIRDYYREMSGGTVTLIGEVTDWKRSTLAQQAVAGGVSGLSNPGRVGVFILELLAQLPGTIDWGRYDNDGPDGRPNSGDDDGYVDVLAVMHPTSGAECGGTGKADRIWSHKWTLRETAGQAYVTASRSPNGSPIRISDYTVQPVYDCSASHINEIGVFAHELGHGFGLPDLYASSHAGAGRWDLMATGSWGCSATFEPEQPCHMGAWSKAMLGWVGVQTLPFGSDMTTVTLDPVERIARVVAIPTGDDSGEYFLLENRQRIGFDRSLPEPGLLIWHVDPWQINNRLAINEVNDNPSRMGVWLRQADGLEQLGLNSSSGGNRGDSGDSFPGSSGNKEFHAGSNPSAFTHTRSTFEQLTRGLPESSSAGVTLTEITPSGERITVRALARYQTVRVRSAVGTGAGGLFTVDGAALTTAEPVIRSAPYQHHIVEAAPGAPLGEGVRRGFSGWEDEPGAGRVRSWVTGLSDADLVALYGGPRELRFDLALEGGRFDVAPGRLVTVPDNPDLWFDEGRQVAVQAVPTGGFEFRSRGGDLAGQPNPALVTMDQPKDVTAVFEMVFGLDPAARVEFSAAAAQHFSLQALNANSPVTFTRRSGVLPEGILLGQDGTVTGEAVEAGVFPIELHVRDALGLEANGTVTLAVTAPLIGTTVLAAPFLFQPGSLTASQERYLDRAGNGNGSYDLGDLRAYLLAHPDVPDASPAAPSRLRFVPFVDFRPAVSR